MNTVHAPSNDANTPPKAKPVLSAEGRPVWVVTTDDAAHLLRLPQDDRATLDLVNWLAHLQCATFYDDPAQA